MSDKPINNTGRNTNNFNSLNTNNTSSKNNRISKPFSKIARQTKRFGATVKNIPSIRGKIEKNTKTEKESGVALPMVTIPQGPFYRSEFSGPNFVNINEISERLHSADEGERRIASIDLKNLHDYLKSLECDGTSESLSQFKTMNNFKATLNAVENLLSGPQKGHVHQLGSKYGDMRQLLMDLPTSFIDPKNYEWDSLNLLKKGEKDAEEIRVSTVLGTLHSVYKELIGPKTLSSETIEDARLLISGAIEQLVKASANAQFQSSFDPGEDMKLAGGFLLRSVGKRRCCSRRSERTDHGRPAPAPPGRAPRGEEGGHRDKPEDDGAGPRRAPSPPKTQGSFLVNISLTISLDTANRS